MFQLKLLFILSFSFVNAENVENCVIGEDCPCRYFPRVWKSQGGQGDDWTVTPLWARPCKERGGSHPDDTEGCIFSGGE